MAETREQMQARHRREREALAAQHLREREELARYEADREPAAAWAMTDPRWDRVHAFRPHPARRGW